MHIAQPKDAPDNSGVDQGASSAHSDFLQVEDEALQLTSSGDDESTDEADECDDDGDIYPAINVSIGPQQTRLTQPETPIAEKKAALLSGPTGTSEDAIIPADRDGSSTSHPVGPRAPPRGTSFGQDGPVVLDAPQATPKPRGRASSIAAPSRSQVSPNRGRRSTMFSFSRSSQSMLSAQTFSNAWARLAPSEPGRKFSKSRGDEASHTRTEDFAPIRQAGSGHGNFSRSSTGVQGIENLSRPKDRPQIVRRTTSDQSIYLQRYLSYASSLGDDSRWQNQHEQVNSRLKAVKDTLNDSWILGGLKDTWADSNLRFPKFPTFSSFGQIVRKPSEVDFGRKTREPAESKTFERRGTVENEPWTASVSEPPPPGMTKQNASHHPSFSRAIKSLSGDLVVLGGYRGSVLRTAEPPHRQLWVPLKVGLNIRKANLEVGIEPEDDERPPDNIIPGLMLKNIGPIDIGRKLFKKLYASKNAKRGRLRIHDYGYDWRLNPLLLSRQLIAFLEKLPCNQPGVPEHERGAMVIAHSLGGLITRHVINKRPDLVGGVLYAGSPSRCVNILGPLRNGDDVLLSSRVLTAQTNFTIRTSFALLPLDGYCFINKETKEEYPVDFFDPKTWEEFALSPCVGRVEPAVPSRNTSKFKDEFFESMGSKLSHLPGRQALSSLTRRRSSQSSPTRKDTASSISSTRSDSNGSGGNMGGISERTAPDSNPMQPAASGMPPSSSALAPTIPKEQAMAYLSRTLANVKQFKEELAFRADVAYPPAAVIYGKSTPTVSGAYVSSREAIRRSDAYDDLAFASGDGVVLARSAQLPDGYKAVKGGVVGSDRGHVSLLGDLEAVGKCLEAILFDKRRRMKKPKQR